MRIPATCGQCPRVIQAYDSHYCMRGATTVIVASTSEPDSECPERVEARALGVAVSSLVERDFKRIELEARIAAQAAEIERLTAELAERDAELRATREALVRAARCRRCREWTPSWHPQHQCTLCEGTGYDRESDAAREAAEKLGGAR